MSKSAKVQDIESIKEFRIALLNFAEKVTNALGEADGEVQRVTMWLENEATAYWAGELRKRQDVVMKAKEALRFKQIFKSPTGGKQSTVDEEKAVAIALRRHAEAEQKALNVKKWIRQLHKESHVYRGAVQRLGTTVSADVPNATAKMARMIQALEGYVALTAPSTVGPVDSGEGSGMSRGEGPDVTGGYEKLRRRSPDAAARDSAGPTDLTVVWTSGELASNDPPKVEKLPFERQPLDPATLVIFAAGVQSARRIYLERSAPSFPGDSGWYIGPVDMAPPPQFESIALGELLRVRPHLDALTSLPVGTLIVIDAAGITAVLDEQDKDVWPA